MPRAKSQTKGPLSDNATQKSSHTDKAWYLETKATGGDGTARFLINEFPFFVGRSQEMELVIPSISVSSCHAEINRNSATGVLHVRDLGSTNGTFVNRRRVHDAPLSDGDTLHFADIEFRFRCSNAEDTHGPASKKAVTLQLGSNVDLPKHFVKGVVELVDLMRGTAVVPLYQAVMRLEDGQVDGYEALARGRHPKLPESPKDLFQIASGLGVESEVSRAFRHRALEVVADRPDLPAIFLNTHPKEMGSDILKSIPTMRKIAPQHQIVLEVHERAMADTKSISELKEALKDHGIGLAYDDFGAGESRLIQLAEVPPDYLKFDISFIKDIEKSPESKRHLLQKIVSVAHDLGVKTVAEGIETDAEAEECTRMGFTHAQGFLFGQPVGVEDL